MKYPKLSNRAYDIIKWLLFVVIPATTALITTLQKAWGWDIPIEGIVITISAVATFIGVITGVSSIMYNKAKGDIENDN